MTHRVIISNNIKQRPNKNEISVAVILANHYKTTIEFIVPLQNYRHKTPDIIMNGLMWEIKSPVGSSLKTTVEKQVRQALKQSSNIIFDSRQTKIAHSIIIKQLLEKANLHKKISRIILISKEGKVIEVYKKR